MLKHHRIKSFLIIVWLCLLLLSGSFASIDQYGGFFLMGIVGAIFASATGAGGGVVFVPFFNQLSFTSETIVATSFAIQCFGMTAGAISWYQHYKGLQKSSGLLSQSANDWQHLPKGLLVCVPTSILGILLAQFALSEYINIVQQGLSLYFGIFSIVLAVAIFGSIFLMDRSASTRHLLVIDLILLAATGFFGGVITACLSVGVGELVAVYLILRGFNISFAIALAVILSAFTVQSGIYYHLFVSKAVYWQVVIFAGAGAIIGGLIAKHVVFFFSPMKLKMFFATWILVMGISGLPIF